MDKLRIGIIGTGRISDLHAIEYLNNPRAQIVALFLHRVAAGEIKLGAPKL